MSRIFVGGFPRDLNEEELKEIFEVYGRVDAVKIVRDKKTGISRRFGFVDMETREIADKAIEELNQGSIDDELISVKHAVVKPAVDFKAQKKKAPKSFSRILPKSKPTGGKRPRIKR